MKKWLVLSFSLAFYMSNAKVVKTKIIDHDGSGQYKAIAATDKSLPDFVIYCPDNIPKAVNKESKLPVVVWANGGCMNSSIHQGRLFSEVSSHGYIIVAISALQMTVEERVHEPTPDDELLKAPDWIYLSSAKHGETCVLLYAQRTNIMVKKIISISLILLQFTFGYGQSEDIISYSVGFKYFKTTDNSRNYIIENDTVNRPMLIHYWYPGQKTSESINMTFKDYIDLIAIREDFNKNRSEIDQMSEGYIDAYLGFSKQQFGIDTTVTTEDVLNSPVKAIYNAKPIVEKFPLIIYAPSNSKSAVQNHIMCEYLASNGFCVVSVGSAGHETLQRYDQGKATLAQVRDMEFTVKYLSDSLKLSFSDIGLFGFSTGSMATIIYQMKTPEVKAVASLDGSHEYAYYFILNEIEDFSFDKANTPYLMIANNYEDISIFPYYSSISVDDKYLYKMTAIDHNGFISYWQQFAMCSKGENKNSTVESYTVLCKSINSFFNATLKWGTENPIEFEIQKNELIKRDTTDYNLIAQLLNQILIEGIDSSMTELKSNQILYKGKANMINVVGKMFLGNDNDIAIKIFTANTEIHPGSWEGFYYLAHAYKARSNKDAAIGAIVKARDINRNNEDIQHLYDEILKMK